MKKTILIYAVIFLVGLVVGWAGGRWTARYNLPILFNKQSGQVQEKITSLNGTVLEVKSQSLVFKTWTRTADNIMAVQKEANIDNNTAIYLLTPKTSDDMFGQDYNNKLVNFNDAIRTAQAQKNTALVKKLVDQAKALTAEAAQAKNQQIKDLEEKIASLPDNSPDKIALTTSLEELNSNLKYSQIKLSDIKAGAVVTVWSNEDLSSVDKFTATKIEVKQ
jgi:hypothetical protein